MNDTRLFALIGNPVAHSLSPVIVNRACAAIGLDARYIALPVPERDLGVAVDGLARLGARGANVTYPFKTAVLDHVGALEERASVIGAVNTLVLEGGAFRGHNTDAPGTAAALARFGGVGAADARVFVFGTGGSARAAAFGLLARGAASVTFASRAREKARSAIEALRREFPAARIDAVGLGENDRARRAEAFGAAGVVINATPVGMALPGEANASPLEDESWIDARQCYFDFVYHPRRTTFLEAARRRGARTVDGLALLVAQAAAAFALWTGHEFDVAEMAAALETFESGVEKA